MLSNMRVALVSLGLVLGAAGCNGFLTGDKLSSNPNSPNSATLQTLFVAMQGAQFALHEGATAMLECMWVQTCGAVNGRFVELGGRYNYGANSNFAAEAGDWAAIYTGGGLLDLNNIKTAAASGGDSVYLGIAKIWEAFTIGMATDLWSGIPYSQAGTATPDTDSQITVYNAIQARLNEAINELTADKVTSHGPRGSDFVFGGFTPSGQRAAWIATAWTLKARYWLHVVNAAAKGKLPGLTAAQVYDSAITAAMNGISDATGAHDFQSVHFSATTQQNMWSQFQNFSGFGADLEAGLPLVEYMKARNDPRLGQYFCPFVTGSWAAGAKHVKGDRIVDKNGNVEKVTAVTLDSLSGTTEPTWPTTPVGTATTTDNHVTWTLTNITPYGGDSFNTVVSPDSVSNFACLPPRFAATASVPYVTYQERELILAEANSTAARGAGGNDATALGYLNAERATTASGTTLPPLPAVVGVTGAALLDSIMFEKWVVMFQNIEGIVDYRRTCRPAITPVAGNFLGIAFVPGRLFYPQSERNVNPTHIPLESAELAAGLRTQADVSTPCHP